MVAGREEAGPQANSVDMIIANESTLRLSIFLGGFTVLSTLEYLFPARANTQNRLIRWSRHFGLTILSTLLVRLIVPAAAVGAAYFAAQNQWGLLEHFELPLWGEIVISFILLDYFIYLQHVLFHIMPIFWRFHRAHHSDTECDVSTGLRFHPIEIIFSIFIKIGIIIVIGAPVVAVIIFEVVLNFMSMFTHANIGCDSRLETLLRWFIVTPNMHRVHHSTKENETNSNFGFCISLWDRLFGTYVANPAGGISGMTIGLDQFRESNWQSFMGILKLPFRTGVRGYAINYRDMVNEQELALARELANKNEAMAKMAAELSSYLEAIGKQALVSVTDTKGKILEVNDKFCEVSGYAREELVEQDHSIVNSGVHPPAFFKALWSSITAGQLWHGEICNRRKDGKLYWVDSTIVPIFSSDGTPYRYLSVRTDITTLKKQTEDLQNAYGELELANERLEELSSLDSLTNIANRRVLDEDLELELRKHARQQQPLTFILCDIDFFKPYNDTYGHTVGDACLKQVARVLQDTFKRSGDLVARYGGEEFAVVLPNTNQDTARVLAEHLRSNIQALGLVHEASEVADVVTISVGVISRIPSRDLTVVQLVQQADNALYTAKAAGRNTVSCCEVG